LAHEPVTLTVSPEDDFSGVYNLLITVEQL
jgi:hypothetical protein